MKKIIFLFSLIALTSCMSYSYTAQYNVQLSSVEQPKDVKKQYGEYISTKYNSRTNHHEDEYIITTVALGEKAISLGIKNKTQHTINVHWEKAAFVGINGVAQPIRHITTHPQSSIPSRATLSDAITRYDSEDLFPVHYETNEDLRRNANRYKGCNFLVILPIEIEGVINEYTFVFLVGEQLNVPEEPRYVDYSVRR